MAEGICCNVSSDDVIGSSGPLGDSHVAVQILSSLSEIDVPDEWRYSVRAWAIEHVYCNGASLKDHEIRATHNSKIAALAMGSTVRKSRPYRSSICILPAVGSTKVRKVLQQQQINLVASKDCCSRRCAQIFPREKIKLLRERMYVGTTFQFWCHLKLDIHRQSRIDHDGRKVVTLEGVDVCHQAWRLIIDVPESTFFQYAKHASKNMVAQMHGNTGLWKPRPHTVHATATLR